MRGTITIDENRCKGCELCAYVCPKHLISLAEVVGLRGYRPAQFNDPRGDCTGCLLCAVICPDAAITIYRAAPEHRANHRVVAASGTAPRQEHV